MDKINDDKPNSRASEVFNDFLCSTGGFKPEGVRKAEFAIKLFEDFMAHQCKV